MTKSCESSPDLADFTTT